MPYSSWWYDSTECHPASPSFGSGQPWWMAWAHPKRFSRDSPLRTSRIDRRTRSSNPESWRKTQWQFSARSCTFLLTTWISPAYSRFQDHWETRYRQHRGMPFVVGSIISFELVGRKDCRPQRQALVVWLPPSFVLGLSRPPTFPSIV